MQSVVIILDSSDVMRGRYIIVDFFRVTQLGMECSVFVFVFVCVCVCVCVCERACVRACA